MASPDDVGQVTPDNIGNVHPRRMILGSMALTVGHTVRLGLQFLLLPILANLLGPESYGLVALALPVVFFMTMLGDCGLGAGLVRAGNASPELESSIFWMSLLVGGGLSVLLTLFAAPFGWLIGHPDLPGILRALAPIIVLSSLCALPFARLQRRGRLEAVAVSDLGSAIAGMIVGFAGAWHGWGAWSLVAQQLALWTVRLSILLVAARVRVRWHFEFRLLRDHMRFGMSLIGSNLVDFASRNIDVLLIGSLIGVKELGFYAMASQIVRMPEAILTGPLFTSIFPAVAAVSTEPPRVTAIYVTALRLTATITTPLLIGLALVAQPAVAVIFGERWALSGVLIAALVPFGLCKCLLPINAAVLIGLGRADLQLRLLIFSSIVSFAGLLAGTWFGVVGAAVGYSAATIAGAPVLFARTAQQLNTPTRGIVVACMPPTAAAAVMAICVASVQWGLSDYVSMIGRLAICIGVGAVTYAGVFILLSWRVLLSDIALLRHRKQP